MDRAIHHILNIGDYFGSVVLAEKSIFIGAAAVRLETAPGLTPYATLQNTFQTPGSYTTRCLDPTAIALRTCWEMWAASRILRSRQARLHGTQLFRDRIKAPVLASGGGSQTFALFCF